MTNADKFKHLFGIYATELWAMSENDFLEWLNADAQDMPTGKWIPCSERLPEVGTYVLVSKKPLSFRSNLPNVCTAHRSRDPRSGKEEWNDMLFGKLDDDDVLAWIPLPEPYVDDIPNEYFESGGK